MTPTSRCRTSVRVRGNASFGEWVTSPDDCYIPILEDMTGSLTDALDDMITESRANIRRLKGFTDQPLFPRALYPSVVAVMHAETLRLDMLRSVYEELGGSESPVPDPRTADSLIGNW
jgi:hypothetical protein